MIRPQLLSWRRAWIAMALAALIGTSRSGHAAVLSGDEILKFDAGPTGQVVMPGFQAVGPETAYASNLGFGWTVMPQYFTRFPKWPAFPDALTCDLAAPSDPMASVGGYKGFFDFRVDLPRGEYRVAVISGNYGYLPSTIEAGAFNLTRNAYTPPLPERILANGQSAWSRQLTSDDLVNEFYHDLNTLLRREMNLWDRVVAWRFPARVFTPVVGDDGLTLRFENMPVNGIIIWPATKESDAQSFLAQLTADRRASFPATETTVPAEKPTPPLNVKLVSPVATNTVAAETSAPDLTSDAAEQGYVFFVPHWSDKIRPNTIPPVAWLKTEVRAAAAQDEIESFSVGVYPLRDLSDCSMSVSDLEGPGGARLLASALEVRTLRYLALQIGEASSYETVAYLPLKGGPIPADQRIPQVWWFTIKVPETATAGDYAGQVRFRVANAPSGTLDVKFHVYPFRLQPLTDHYQALYHDYYQFPGGGQDRSVQWQRDAGFNVITTRGNIPRLAYHDGQMSQPDFSDWGRQIEVYRRNGFPMRLVISQSALWAAYAATGEYVREPGFGAHQVKDQFSAGFEDCYKQLARAISDEFQRRGWPDILFYEGGELACAGPRGVRTETHLMRLLHDAGVKNTTSIYGQATPLSLVQSVPWMYLTMLEEVNSENVRRVRQAGSRLGIYGPGETRFERGFWFWRTGAELCSEEGGVVLFGNPFDPFDGLSSDWGDVYPSPDGPTPSLHTIGKREGIDDSRYLFQLEQLIAEASALPDARLASAHARTVLDEISSQIAVDIRYYQTVVEEPTGVLLDDLRRKLALEIQALESTLRK